MSRSDAARVGHWMARSQALRHLAALVRLAWAASPRLTVASVVLRLGRALLPAIILYLGQLIVDAIVLETQRGPQDHSLTDWLMSGRMTTLSVLLLLEFAMTVASVALGRASALTDSLLSERYGNLASLRLMNHAAALDLEQLENSTEQDRLDRARRQVTGRTSLLSQLLGQAQDILTAASLAGALLAFAPWLIVLLCIALLPAFVAEKYFNAQSYRLDYFRTPERRQLDYLRYLGSSTETAKEVKLFGLAPFLAERFASFAEAMYADNSWLAARRALWGTLFSALGTAAYYVAYASIVLQTLSGHLSLGGLTFLAGSFLRLRGLIEGLLLGFSQIAGQLLYLGDLFHFLEAKPNIRAAQGALRMPRPMRSGFVFEDVGFRYPDTDTWAVRHLDLTIAAGEVLALVGQNGAGKTTIVKLLSRLYDPTEGRVLLDGQDLRAYDLDDLRACVGIVFQDFVRFHLTAADNIGVGRVERIADRGRIADAASRSLADEMIARLPLRYDQQLGRRFQGGVDLSGGEWQKIAVARAYMRDADLLVLDEPTAALDARAEAEVFARFKDLSRGRTTVLISHRFSTVRMANRIVVLGGGRVVEGGTHAELMAMDGTYAHLFDLQASGYR